MTLKRIVPSLILTGLLATLTPSFLLAQNNNSAINKIGGELPREDFIKAFNMMAGKKGYIDLETAPGFFRFQMQAYARRNGITSGKLSRSDFLNYVTEQHQRQVEFKKSMEERQKEREQRQNNQDSSPQNGGRNRPGFNGQQQNQNNNRDSNQDKMSVQDFYSRVNREADSYFSSRDRNKDGFLDKDEMSSRLRDSYQTYDRNRDGKITLAEARNYIGGFFEKRFENRISQWKNSSKTIDQELLGDRPAVYRAGKLPEELAGSWFEEDDIDQDGQIGLYEWQRTGKSFEEFQNYDRNDDGFLSSEELLYYNEYFGEPSLQNGSP